MKPLDPHAVPLAGTTLIEASAGTGKTHTITTLFIRLLLERELAVDRILVVTFTRAATAELRDRIRRRLASALRLCEGREVDDAPLCALFEARHAAGTDPRADALRLAAALRDFDEAGVFTIHGFCQRVLADNAFESASAFDVELVEDTAPLVEEVVQDYWARAAYGASPELVHGLQRHESGPDGLATIAHRACASPRMPLLPEHVDEPELDPAPVAAARARVAAAWRSDREEVLGLLCVPGVLNRNSYPPDKIRAEWAPSLDHLESSRDLPDFFDKLTPAKLARRTNRGQTRPAHPFFGLCDALWKAQRGFEEALSQRVLALRMGMAEYARRELAARKREAGAQSFDDLLNALADALAGRAGVTLARRVRERFAAALIDEFQDTDPVQYDIFRTIYGGSDAPLFLIGDPKQAIYGFRGADVFSYMAASRHAGDAGYTLQTNYRSDPAMVRGVSALFARAPRPFLFDGIGFHPAEPAPDARDRVEGALAQDPALTFLFVRRAPAKKEGAAQAALTKTWGNAQLPRRVAWEIARLLGSGSRVDGEPIAPRHVAVLCRTNAQARDVQSCLRELHVPSVLEGDSSVFDAPMAEELERLLSGVARPADGQKLRAALATSILGVNGPGLFALQEGEGELDDWLERFARWSQLWHERGFVQAAWTLMGEAEVQRRLLGLPDGERRLTDLLHLVELLHRAAAQHHLKPQSLLHWLAQMRQDREARGALVAASAQVRLESDARAVRLTTIHKSKGLEYPIVFCPFLWASQIKERPPVRFHDADDAERMKLDLGGPDSAAHTSVANLEAMAESLRIAYVALTRARHRCYVVWGRFTHNGSSPLAYLLHGEAGDADARDPGGRVEQRIKAAHDSALLASLEGLARAAPGAVGVRELASQAAPAPDAEAVVTESLVARPFDRPLDVLHRTSSFSALTARDEAGAHAPEDDGADHDAGDRADVEGRAAGEPAASLGLEPPAPLPLADFPAGARPGTALHAILEHADFGADATALEALCEAHLARYGIDAARWSAPLSRALAAALRTPLGDSGVALADVSRADRIDEMEFLLPVRGDERLTAGRLARCLREHAAPAVDPAYADRVEALSFAPLSGFLKGFVDLVFRVDGRYYLVDYKSNLLGSVASDYAPGRLAAPMGEHHYYLQYHLYTVALHRHLSQRLPGYDYARDFGGVYYLFLRGMAPDHPRGTGIFQDRPSAALVQALSAALGGEVAA